ncbi:MAG TPA: DUF1801 domain-containing protein [Acidimicrobiales bacterium]|nr:DUF1801 domain-containing protein [Acidimicrobiales bacterium]
MAQADGEAPSDKVDRIIEGIGDWRGQALSRMRNLVKEADERIVEEVKWVKPTNPNGVPTWSLDGLICTGEVYKSTVKLTFASGAALDDPAGLFNAGFGGNTRRAIDIGKDDEVDADAFKALVRAAVAHNEAKAAGKRKKQ